MNSCRVKVKGKGGPYSITELRVPELIPFLGSHRAGDVSHKPGGRLPLLSARPGGTGCRVARTNACRQAGVQPTGGGIINAASGLQKVDLRQLSGWIWACR